MSRSSAMIAFMVLAVGLVAVHAEGVVTTTGQSMPRALKSYDVFPYSSCNTSPSLSPWRAKLIKLENVLDGQIVSINIFTDSLVPCINGCSALLLDLNVLSGYSIVDATIGGVSCPIVSVQVGTKLTQRFTNLNVPCSVGQAGRILKFKIKGSTLAAVAGSTVNYAIYELASLLGLCPCGSFSPLLEVNLLGGLVDIAVGK